MEKKIPVRERLQRARAKARKRSAEGGSQGVYYSGWQVRSGGTYSYYLYGQFYFSASGGESTIASTGLILQSAQSSDLYVNTWFDFNPPVVQVKTQGMGTFNASSQGDVVQSTISGSVTAPNDNGYYYPSYYYSFTVQPSDPQDLAVSTQEEPPLEAAPSPAPKAADPQGEAEIQGSYQYLYVDSWYLQENDGNLVVSLNANVKNQTNSFQSLGVTLEASSSGSTFASGSCSGFQAQSQPNSISLYCGVPPDEATQGSEITAVLTGSISTPNGQQSYYNVNRQAVFSLSDGLWKKRRKKKTQAEKAE